MLTANFSNNVTFIGHTPNNEKKLPNLNEYAADVTNYVLIFSNIIDAISKFGKISNLVFMQRYRYFVVDGGLTLRSHDLW